MVPYKSRCSQTYIIILNPFTPEKNVLGSNGSKRISVELASLKDWRMKRIEVEKGGKQGGLGLEFEDRHI